MKYLIIGGVIGLFYTSCMAATPYIGGYFGSNIFKTHKIKTTNHRKEKDIRVHYKSRDKHSDLVHCVDLKALKNAFADLTTDWGENALVINEDIVTKDSCMSFIQNLGLDYQTFISFINSGILDSVGLTGDAATKIENFLKNYKAKMSSFFSEKDGFIIQGNPEFHFANNDKNVSLDVKKIEILNRYLPSFQSALIWGSGDKRDGTTNTNLDLDYFGEDDDFRKKFVAEFLNPPDLIVQDWYQALADQSNEPEPSVINESDIASSSSSMTQQNTAFTWGATLGIHRTFFAHHSYFGGYMGTELFYEMNCGTIHLTSSEDPSNTFLLKGKTYVYDQEMPAINNVIKIKTRNSVGVTAFAGVATQNYWLVYFPISLKLTCYRMEFCPDIASIVKYDHIAAPKGVGMQNKHVFEAFHMAMNPNSETRPANHRIEKNKLGFEYGIGLRTSLTRSVMFGVRWMHSIGAKLDFKTPPYASYALHDLDRFGTDTTMHVGSSTFSVEFLFNF